MFKVDDIIADLIDEGWNVSLSSKLVDGDDGFAAYTGHQVKVSTNRWNGNLLRKDVAPARLLGTCASAAEVASMLQTIASIAAVAVKQESFSPKVELESVTSLTVRPKRQPVITKQMTVLEIADEMMNAGWGYSDTISARGSSEGKLHRHLGFNRWDWHGERIGSTVSIWHLASVNANWDNLAYVLAQKSLQAWNDFPDSIPYMNTSGELVKDKFKTMVVFGK